MADFDFDDSVFGNFVVKQETVTIAAEHEGHLQHFGIAQPLLHAIAQGVFVVLGLDDRNRHAWLVEQNIVGALVLRTGVQPASDDDAPFGE